MIANLYLINFETGLYALFYTPTKCKDYWSNFKCSIFSTNLMSGVKVKAKDKYKKKKNLNKKKQEFNL